MKKTIIISVLAVLITCIGFVSGYSTGNKAGRDFILSQYSLMHANYNTLPYKIEVIKAQRAALEAADKVMDNNELFDADGSDIMCDYLNKVAVVDSLYKLEQQVNPTALLIL